VILIIVILGRSLLVTLFVKSAKELCFIDWKSYLFKSEPRLQIACGIHEIACNADNFGNIPLGELNLNFKKWRQVIKFCLPLAVIIPMRACSTMPLSDRSNLVRRYL
jgi:hypothetical protein